MNRFQFIGIWSLAWGIPWVLIGCEVKPQPQGKSETVIVPQPPENPSPEPISAENIAQASQHRQLGLDYRQQERYEEAIAQFQKSVTLDPHNLSGQVLLGWTLHLTGQEVRAAQILQTALVQDPSHEPALNALGIVYLVQGDLTAAVKTHTQAVELNPDNEIAHYNLSLAYQRLQQSELAIAHGLRATELEPENPHPWVALAIAYWSSTDPSAAAQAYQRAIELDDRYHESAFLDHLKLAGFSLEQIQLTNQVRQAR
ncbi:MAG: tetratricopeptide repeat protein [Oscillatoriales cyanobacterium RM2_1_1]|nr:tetratricopeptide repeat protein [Oscillatoriales cyanobacterium SM2_3_0]NJO44963.1 tetratricopeptide repeat protein [Oscillatoriales cyanobacterium RM2_1_1]